MQLIATLRLLTSDSVCVMQNAPKVSVVRASERYTAKTVKGKAIAETKNFRASLAGATDTCQAMLLQSESLQKQQDTDRADRKHRQELEDQRCAQEQQRLQEDTQQQHQQFSQLMGMFSSLTKAPTAPAE